MSTFVERHKLNRALIVVDVEKDFCEGGALAVTDGNKVARKIAEYIDNRAEDYALITATKDWHIDPGSHWSDTPDFVDSWPKHCEALSSGADFSPYLGTAIEYFMETTFYKGMYAAAYSGFEAVNAIGDGLDMVLAGHDITHVDVVGLAFDYCVRATALDAAARGYKTRVLSGMTAAVHNATQALLDVMDELEAAGVEVV